ncbi:hypothetical protein ALC53_10703 [Atta colombica]|uniref:Uncharacterized protein n=1 Tax=Atta colombica TaxID=520822 RepID=A0A151I0S3_9HYME|nr:hypothetical protein ALC53_10703 [Atta colombica]
MTGTPGRIGEPEGPGTKRRRDPIPASDVQCRSAATPTVVRGTRHGRLTRETEGVYTSCIVLQLISNTNIDRLLRELPISVEDFRNSPAKTQDGHEKQNVYGFLLYIEQLFQLDSHKEWETLVIEIVYRFIPAIPEDIIVSLLYARHQTAVDLIRLCILVLVLSGLAAFVGELRATVVMRISFSSEKQKTRKRRKTQKRKEIRRVSARIRMAIDGIGYYKLQRKSYLSAVKGEVK